MCQQDNFILSHMEFYVSLCNVVWALDKVLPSPEINNKNEGRMRALANVMFVRSGGKMPRCVGALDDMAVRITRPTSKDTASPKFYFNGKGFYSVNLQAIAEYNRKIVWWNINTVASIHGNMAWVVTPLAEDRCP